MRRILLAAAFAAFTLPAFGQGFRLPPNTIWDGHQITNGIPPTVAGCGSPSLIGGSTDLAGRFTAGATTGCVLTFATPFATVPFCMVQDVTTAADSGGYTLSTTAITFGTVVNGDTIAWICFAKNPG